MLGRLGVCVLEWGGGQGKSRVLTLSTRRVRKVAGCTTKGLISILSPLMSIARRHHVPFLSDFVDSGRHVARVCECGESRSIHKHLRLAVLAHQKKVVSLAASD